MTNVLLVCHANTCRSVMAHVLLEKMLVERRRDGTVRVRSGGVANHARDGMIPSLDARIVLREDDIHLAEDAFASTDLRRHREIVAEAHLIVTMTAQQKAMIGAYEEAQGRPILTLHELAGEGGDVDDPFGQGEDRYRATKDEIKRCLELGVDRMLTLLQDRKEISAMSDEQVLYDPTAEPRILASGLAPRLESLEGKRAGILDNSKANAGTLMLAVVARLKEKYGVRDVVKREKGIAGAPSPDILAALTTCDFVLVGSAD